MLKSEVIDLLFNMGFIKDLSFVSEGNSKYDKYVKKNEIMYLGNYFIENESLPHAFPYKDSDSTKKDLIEFINSK